MAPTLAAPTSPYRAQPRRDRGNSPRIFALHHIAELVAPKSSRIRADDSALVSAKCRAQNRPENSLVARNLPLCELRSVSAATSPARRAGVASCGCSALSRIVYNHSRHQTSGVEK